MKPSEWLIEPFGRGGLRRSIAMIAVLGSVANPAAAVDLVAHRGASADAPENTLPAFNLAWERGADAVEGDFFLTSDHEIVCFHDKTTEKRTGEKRNVTSSTYAQLQTLDVGVWKGPEWEGIRIPKLAEVLATRPPDRGRFFIEIKDSVRIVKPLVEELAKSDVPTSRLTILCFNERVVAACKAAMPEVDAHWLVGKKTYEELGVAGVLETVKRVGADGIDIQASTAITPELGKALRKHGLQFHCWTVNDIPLARHMVKMGVDSITTDRPDLLRRGLPAAKTDDRILRHLSFGDEGTGPAGIVGGAWSNAVLNTGLTLPASGTVALWYRPTEWHDYQTIFDSTRDPDVWELWINQDAEIGFRTTSDDVRITHRLHPVAALEQWQHLAVTWDDRRVRLYVNGAPVVKAARRRATPSNGMFCLGGGNAGNTRGTGCWDEVVVMDAVLSPAEVKALMLDGVKTPSGGKLVGKNGFNELTQ